MKTFYEQFKNFNVPKLNYALVDACKAKEFDKAKYIMSSPELSEHGSPFAFESDALRQICKLGCIEMVEYILNLPEAQNSNQFHANIALTEACSVNDLSLVKYLFHSTNIPNKADVNCLGGAGAFYFASRNDSLDVLQYLIFDMRIEKCEQVKKQMSFLENMDTYEKVYYWFKNRDLADELKVELEPTNVQNKKIKL